MKSNSSLVTRHLSLAADAAEASDWVRLSIVSRMLDVSEDDLRTSYCAAHGLTLIDISKPGARRRRFRMILKEVIAHKEKLEQNAQRRAEVKLPKDWRVVK